MTEPELLGEIALLDEAFSDIEPDIDMSARLERDATTLRRKSVTEGPLGRGDSDYFHLWDLYQRMRERLLAMDNDPMAFIGPGGEPDLLAMKVYKELMGETRKILETLQKVRNSDKFITSIVEEHTKAYVEALVLPLGHQLKQLLTLLEADDADKAKLHLLSMLRRELATIFREAGEDSLRKTKEEYNLN